MVDNRCLKGSVRANVVRLIHDAGSSGIFRRDIKKIMGGKDPEPILLASDMVYEEVQNGEIRYFWCGKK